MAVYTKYFTLWFKINRKRSVLTFCGQLLAWWVWWVWWVWWHLVCVTYVGLECGLADVVSSCRLLQSLFRDVFPLAITVHDPEHHAIYGGVWHKTHTLVDAASVVWWNACQIGESLFTLCLFGCSFLYFVFHHVTRPLPPLRNAFYRTLPGVWRTHPTRRHCGLTANRATPCVMWKGRMDAQIEVC